MKRYLTIDEETMKNCLRSASSNSYGFDISDCEKCPVQHSYYCLGSIADPCWKSVFNWLTDDVSAGNDEFEKESIIYAHGYNNGWDDGRKALVKAIEEKAGIVRKERDRK